jgi:hypothetical protein
MVIGDGPQRCYAMCAPEGPNEPFAQPVLIWLDGFRILVMIMGVLLVVWTPSLILQARAVGQQARLLGQGIFSLIVIGTEVDHIGDYANYRLFLSFLGIAIMLWGTRRLSVETSPRTRPEHRMKE